MFVFTYNVQAIIYRFVLPAPQYAEEHTDFIRISLGDADFEPLEGVTPQRRPFEVDGVDGSLVSKFDGNWATDVWEHYCCKTPTAALRRRMPGQRCGLSGVNLVLPSFLIAWATALRSGASHPESPVR